MGRRGNSAVKSAHRKKRRLFLAAAAITSAVLFSGIGRLVYLIRKEPCVGSINGFGITREEYTQAMSRYIAMITSSYAYEYGKGTPEEFWGTAGKANKPLKELHQKTQSYLTARYVLFGMAREYGLLEAIDYASLKDALETENEYRADPDRTKPIYGPAQYEFNEYLAYLSSRFAIELTEFLKKDGVISVTEEEIRRAYEENPTFLGSTEPYYAILEATMELVPGQELARQELNRMTAALDAGQTVPQEAGGWSVSERVIDDSNYREVSRLEPEMLEVLVSLEEGKVSCGVIVGNVCSIYKMIERREAEPLPYGEIKGLYEKRLAEESFEELIAKKCGGASVRWEEEKLPRPGDI